jgi:hypothetical protein
MFSEWMEVSVSALITDCRYAGLQHLCVMPRRPDYSWIIHGLFTPQCFPGNTFLFQASYSTPYINSLSDPVSASRGADSIQEENL